MRQPHFGFRVREGGTGPTPWSPDALRIPPPYPTRRRGLACPEVAGGGPAAEELSGCNTRPWKPRDSPRRPPTRAQATPTPAASRVRDLDPHTLSGKHGAGPTSLHTRGETRGWGARDTRPPGPEVAPARAARPPPRATRACRDGSEHQSHWEGEPLAGQGVRRPLAGLRATARRAVGLPHEEGLCAPRNCGRPRASVFSVSR